MSIKKKRSRSKGKNNKNNIDMSSIHNLKAILDRNFKKDGHFHKKLPVNMSMKGSEREIGTLEFEVEIAYKTKEEK